MISFLREIAELSLITFIPALSMLSAYYVFIMYGMSEITFLVCVPCCLILYAMDKHTKGTMHKRLGGIKS
jgi:hypothetical protein